MPNPKSLFSGLEMKVSGGRALAFREQGPEALGLNPRAAKNKTKNPRSKVESFGPSWAVYKTLPENKSNLGFQPTPTPKKIRWFSSFNIWFLTGHGGIGLQFWTGFRRLGKELQETVGIGVYRNLGKKGVKGFMLGSFR